MYKIRRTMKRQTGIWIDTQKAFIVTLDESGHATKTLLSQIETKERIPGESKDFTRFGKQYFSPEEKKEHKRKQEVRDFLKAILKEIKTSDEIVIFGPAGMKKEMEKFILEDKSLKLSLNPVETADKMTENQMISWVKDYFGYVAVES
jgi:stalled ribosome rescue protein Dom34